MILPYLKDYIVSGDFFADEMVLCIRCSAQIMGLTYKPMPNVNDPTKTVNVACKKKFGNYRQMAVLLYRKGQDRICYLPCCQECLKEIDPERDTDQLVRQIKRAMQIEARWVGAPEEAVEGIARQYADARIIRKLNPQEMIEGKILEAV